MRLARPGCAALLLTAALALAGCQDELLNGVSDAGSSSVRDGGGEDTGTVDAGHFNPGECTCDPVEDCHGCFELIGRCCYEDPTWFGHIDQLVANCEANASCAVCCNECLAKTCDQLIASHDCPIQ